MAQLGLTPRIIRRKTGPPSCKKCGVPIRARDDGWHLDADAVGECKDCYAKHIEEIFQRKGEICWTCHFARAMKGVCGRFRCQVSQAKIQDRDIRSGIKKGCPRWKRKDPRS